MDKVLGRNFRWVHALKSQKGRIQLIYDKTSPFRTRQSATGSCVEFLLRIFLRKKMKMLRSQARRKQTIPSPREVTFNIHPEMEGLLARAQGENQGANGGDVLIHQETRP